MVEAGHVAYTDRFHELARLVPHLVTPESRKIERYVYGLAPQICMMVEKRGNVGGPSKDKSGRDDDNKRTRTRNVFASTANPICRMVATTEPKTMHQAVQISGALTDEAVRNGSIKKVGKKGNMGEPIMDKNGRDDNKRTRTENAFATTANPV
nr:reverse transcriptase domain-containing protein [Tanacetum cinerariifolium]